MIPPELQPDVFVLKNTDNHVVTWDGPGELTLGFIAQHDLIRLSLSSEIVVRDSKSLLVLERSPRAGRAHDRAGLHNIRVLVDGQKFTVSSGTLYSWCQLIT